MIWDVPQIELLSSLFGVCRTLYQNAVSLLGGAQPYADVVPRVYFWCRLARRHFWTVPVVFPQRHVLEFLFLVLWCTQRVLQFIGWEPATATERDWKPRGCGGAPAPCWLHLSPNHGAFTCELHQRSEAGNPSRFLVTCGENGEFPNQICVKFCQFLSIFVKVCQFLISGTGTCEREGWGEQSPIRSKHLPCCWSSQSKLASRSTHSTPPLSQVYQHSSKEKILPAS